MNRKHPEMGTEQGPWDWVRRESRQTIWRICDGKATCGGHVPETRTYQVCISHQKMKRKALLSWCSLKDKIIPHNLQLEIPDWNDAICFEMNWKALGCVTINMFSICIRTPRHRTRTTNYCQQHSRRADYLILCPLNFVDLRRRHEF